MSITEQGDLKSLKNFFANRSKEIKEEKNEMLSIIGSHLEIIDNSSLSEIDKQKNKKELIDLGKFIRLYDKSITISEAIRESPDFIIKRKHSVIGIELRDIYTDADAKKTEGTVEKLFREIELELKDIANSSKGIYRVHFKENISFKSQQREIKDEIIDFIKSNKEPQNHIKSIEKNIHSRLHIYSNEASTVGPLRKEVIIQALTDKEKNLTAYKTSSNASEFWLLLVLEGLKDSSDYSHIENSIINDSFETGFNKVFIIDFFKSKIIELKK